MNNFKIKRYFTHIMYKIIQSLSLGISFICANIEVIPHVMILANISLRHFIRLPSLIEMQLTMQICFC